MKSICIIPARGGSKGIPRKNLRPLCGKPLIYYSISTALKCDIFDEVAVTTEDEEIAVFAERFGARVIVRPADLAEDNVPLDPVVEHAVLEIEKVKKISYDLVFTIQPTSPLISCRDIENVKNKFANPETDTVLTVVEDIHLRWGLVNDKIAPLYEERLNRQLLPKEWKENGAIIACRRDNLSSGTRIGRNIDIHPMDAYRSIDIDTLNEFWLCEVILSRKKLCFNVIGNKEVGMGHVYRSLLLANEFVNHEIIFHCPKSHSLARKHITKHNYTLNITDDNEFPYSDDLKRYDLIINDILDTNVKFINWIKNNHIKVVNFEDLGGGTKYADLVVNALYSHKSPKSNMITGPEYFCLRDEFIHIGSQKHHDTVKRILVTFGGVDEGNLTCRIIKILNNVISNTKIKVTVIFGPGYSHFKRFDSLLSNVDSNKFRIIKKTNKISEYMFKADIAITSAGRTALEIASLEKPTIVIAQNSRETTHTFASQKNGFLNLGHRKNISDKKIKESINKLITDAKLRETMRSRMRKLNLRDGKKKVVNLIRQLLEE